MIKLKSSDGYTPQRTKGGFPAVLKEVVSEIGQWAEGQDFNELLVTEEQDYLEITDSLGDEVGEMKFFIRGTDYDDGIVADLTVDGNTGGRECLDNTNRDKVAHFILRVQNMLKKARLGQFDTAINSAEDSTSREGWVASINFATIEDDFLDGFIQGIIEKGYKYEIDNDTRDEHGDFDEGEGEYIIDGEITIFGSGKNRVSVKRDLTKVIETNGGYQIDIQVSDDSSTINSADDSAARAERTYEVNVNFSCFAEDYEDEDDDEGPEDFTVDNFIEGLEDRGFDITGDTYVTGDEAMDEVEWLFEATFNVTTKVRPKDIEKIIEGVISDNNGQSISVTVYDEEGEPIESCASVDDTSTPINSEEYDSDWDRFDVFEPCTKKWMPDKGEGETMASQLVTAVNKLVYKWFNDGDVYDNTGALKGWANDLSSYANWIAKYYPNLEEILIKIGDIKTEAEYEQLLFDLASAALSEDFLDAEGQKAKQGSIYDDDPEGGFEFVEEEECCENCGNPVDQQGMTYCDNCDSELHCDNCGELNEYCTCEDEDVCGTCGMPHGECECTDDDVNIESSTVGAGTGDINTGDININIGDIVKIGDLNILGQIKKLVGNKAEVQDKNSGKTQTVDLVEHEIELIESSAKINSDSEFSENEHLLQEGESFTEGDPISKGDVIVFNSNRYGAKDKYFKVTVKGIGSGLAGRGNPRPERVIKVVGEGGSVYSIDEGAIVRILSSTPIQSATGATDADEQYIGKLGREVVRLLTKAGDGDGGDKTSVSSNFEYGDGQIAWFVDGNSNGYDDDFQYVVDYKNITPNLADLKGDAQAIWEDLTKNLRNMQIEETDFDNDGVISICDICGENVLDGEGSEGEGGDVWHTACKEDE